jgi:hypothetical protein
LLRAPTLVVIRRIVGGNATSQITLAIDEGILVA